MLKFAGLDNHQVAIHYSRVHHVVSSTMTGSPCCNLYFENGQFITVKGTLDETLAVLEHGNAEDDKANADRWREIARIRRQADLEAEAAITESELFSGDYARKRHHVETHPDGTKVITVTLTPKKSDDDSTQAKR
jgi:hypothetical protein